MLQRELKVEAGALRTVWGHLIASVSAVVLFTSLLGTNVVQMSSFVFWPFSKKLFRSVNCACARFWWGLCVVFQEKLYRIKLVFTGDDVPERENAFVISNHQAMTDILILFSLAVRKGRLGNLKFFVKDVLKYVPGLGWGMLFLDCLFLKRNWEQDQARIQETFGKFERENIPLWLISYVEGTRIRKKKWEKSQAYAKEKGLPVLENLLLPRTKGFVAVVKNLRGHLDAVYDLTITYPQGVPRLWQVVQGFVAEFHLHVRRFEIATLPTTDKELSNWLMDRYVEKDHFLASQFSHLSSK